MCIENPTIGMRVITTNDWYARLFGAIPKGSRGKIISTNCPVLAKVIWDHLEEPSCILYSILEEIND